MFWPFFCCCDEREHKKGMRRRPRGFSGRRNFSTSNFHQTRPSRYRESIFFNYFYLPLRSGRTLFRVFHHFINILTPFRSINNCVVISTLITNFSTPRQKFSHHAGVRAPVRWKLIYYFPFSSEIIFPRSPSASHEHASLPLFRISKRRWKNISLKAWESSNRNEVN